MLGERATSLPEAPVPPLEAGVGKGSEQSMWAETDLGHPDRRIGIRDPPPATTLQQSDRHLLSTSSSTPVPELSSRAP